MVNHLSRTVEFEPSPCRFFMFAKHKVCNCFELGYPFIRKEDLQITYRMQLRNSEVILASIIAHKTYLFVFKTDSLNLRSHLGDVYDCFGTRFLLANDILAGQFNFFGRKSGQRWWKLLNWQILFPHVALDQQEVFDVFHNLDLFQEWLLFGILVLQQASPLSSNLLRQHVFLVNTQTFLVKLRQKVFPTFVRLDFA